MTKTSETAMLEKEGDLHVTLYPESDGSSQGASPEEAVADFKEAMELFLKGADPEEAQPRLQVEVFATRLRAACGKTTHLL